MASLRRVALVANTEWYLYNFRLNLARFLREAGTEVTLISPPGPYAEKLQDCGFEWRQWNLGRKTLNPFGELTSLLALTRLYRRGRYDLVHHHTIKPVLYGSLAARWAEIPAVVHSITGRGFVFGEENRARWLKRIVRPFYRLALAGGNYAVIFENESDRQYFLRERLASQERTWLIEGVGVDPERFSTLPEPEGPPVVLLPARMLWDKGVGVLVEAARLLKPRLPARFALAGMPDPGNPHSVDEATLRAWDAEGMIEWWGWQEDIRQAYARAHIVTLPTMYGEGVPTALLEGAACGRPLVATDTPGCRPVVIDGVTGLLVPPGDAAALAAALERLIGDPALRGRMGAAGKKLILSKYTIVHVNSATLHVYHTLLNK